jgi:hypothetical protein
MDTRSCSFILSKLINQAHASIREYQRATFEHEFTRHRIFVHRSSQTDCGRAFARRVHGARRRLLRVL